MSPRGTHPRSVANLRKGGAPPAPSGNQRRRTHGAYAAIALDRLAAREADVYAALAADAPLRDADGGLPAADGALVRLAAEVLCRLDSVGNYLARRGLEDADGELRMNVLEIEGRLRREAADHLDALGCSPRSRARLGVDMARMVDPLEAWHARRAAGDTDPDDDTIDGDAS